MGSLEVLVPYYEGFRDLMIEYMPLPLIFAFAVIMLTPLWFFRGGALTPFLNPDKWKALPLSEKKVVSHNTRYFRFDLPHSTQPVGLPVGQHISLKAVTDDGTEIMKPYTPVSDLDVRGYVEFVIKVYPEGRMSQHLDKMQVGDTLLFKGPRGRFEYEANMKHSIGMIAGGTGITPMYQVAKAILSDPEDFTQIDLIYANVTADDILIKAELDDLASQHARFSIYYVLNKPPEGWKGGVGFVSKDMITAHLPKPASDVLVLRCGPPAMNKAMRAHLNELGYNADMQFEF